MSPGGTGQGGTLASLAIEFVTKGQEAVKAGIAQLQESIKGFAAATAQAGASMQGAMQGIGTAVSAAAGKIGQLASATASAAKKMAEGLKTALTETSKLGEAFQRMSDHITVALGAGVAVVGNFVRQGLAAGVMGQVLSFQMERLALTMSGLFRPTIQKVIDGVSQLVNWINSLSNEQKANIAHWLEGAAAAAAVGVILPRIIAGIRGVAVAVVALGEAIAAGELATGIGAILPIIGLIAQAVTLIAVGTETGRSALGQLWETIKGVGKAFADIWEKSGMPQFLEAAGRALAVVLNTVTKLASSFANLFSRMMPNIDFGKIFETGLKSVVMLAEAISAVVSGIMELIGAVWEGVGMNELIGEFVNLWHEAVQTLQLVTFQVVEFVKEFWKISGLGGVFRGILNVVIAIGKAIASMIGGLLKAASWVLSKIRGALDPEGKFENMFKAPAAEHKAPGDHSPDVRRTGGFEDLKATYQRIAVAALRASYGAKDPQQAMIEEQQRANRTLDQIRDNTGNPRSPIGR